MERMRKELEALKKSLAQLEAVANPTVADLNEVQKVKVEALQIRSAIANIRRQMGYRVA